MVLQIKMKKVTLYCATFFSNIKSISWSQCFLFKISYFVQVLMNDIR